MATSKRARPPNVTRPVQQQGEDWERVRVRVRGQKGYGPELERDRHRSAPAQNATLARKWWLMTWANARLGWLNIIGDWIEKIMSNELVDWFMLQTSATPRTLAGAVLLVECFSAVHLGPESLALHFGLIAVGCIASIEGWLPQAFYKNADGNWEAKIDEQIDVGSKREKGLPSALLLFTIAFVSQLVRAELFFDSIVARGDLYAIGNLLLAGTVGLVIFADDMQVYPAVLLHIAVACYIAFRYREAGFPLGMIVLWGARSCGIAAGIIVARSDGRAFNLTVHNRKAILKRAKQVTPYLAHEFRNLANGLVMSVEMLRSSGKLGREYLDTLRVCTHDMETLCNIYLDVGLYLDGKLVLVEKPLSLHRDVCYEVSQQYKMMANGKGFEFVYECDEPLKSSFLVQGDSTRLRQIITNLVSNSCKYTKSGRVQLTVKWKSEPEQSQNVANGILAGKALISVADTGCGMPEEDLQRLGQRFLQRGKNLGSSGLGLNLAFSLIHAMNGKYEYASQVGQGTEVTVSIPFKAFEASKSKSMEQCTLTLQVDSDNRSTEWAASSAEPTPNSSDAELVMPRVPKGPKVPDTPSTVRRRRHPELCGDAREADLRDLGNSDNILDRWLSQSESQKISTDSELALGASKNISGATSTVEEKGWAQTEPSGSTLSKSGWLRMSQLDFSYICIVIWTGCILSYFVVEILYPEQTARHVPSAIMQLPIMASILSRWYRGSTARISGLVFRIFAVFEGVRLHRAINSLSHVPDSEFPLVLQLIGPGIISMIPQVSAFSVPTFNDAREPLGYIAFYTACRILEGRLPFHRIISTATVSWCIACSLISRRTEMAKALAAVVSRGAQIDLERRIAEYTARTFKKALSGVSIVEFRLEECYDNDKYDEHLVDILDKTGKNIVQLCTSILDVAKLVEGKLTLSLAAMEIGPILKEIVSTSNLHAGPLARVSLIVEDEDLVTTPVFGDSFRIKQALNWEINMAIKSAAECAQIFFRVTWTDEKRRGMVFSICFYPETSLPNDTTSKAASYTDELENQFGRQLSEGIIKLANGQREEYHMESGLFRVMITLPFYDISNFEGNISHNGFPPRSCSPSSPARTTASARPAQHLLAKAEDDDNHTECGSPTSDIQEPQGSSCTTYPRNILIVDDIKMNRMMLTRLLKKLWPEANISVCENGEQCLEFGNSDVDFILLDQFMDKSGGTLLGSDTTVLLRKRSYKGIIVGCSGSDEMVSTFRAAGANGFITKPVGSAAQVKILWQGCQEAKGRQGQALGPSTTDLSADSQFVVF